MDVTSETFAAIFPELEAELEKAEFLAVDFEMTGIGLEGGPRSSYEDTPADRYAKMRPVASRYSIVQMGLCLFTKKEGGGKKKSGGAQTLLARPYNFYTFAEEGADVTLSLSAMHFLKRQGMDFNKWIRNGVSFLNAAGEQYLLKKLEQEREKDRREAEAAGGGGGEERTKMKLNRKQDIDFVKKQMETLENWYEGKDGNDVHGGSAEEIKEAARRKKELLLCRCNAFLRRAMYEAIEAAHPELIKETRDGQVVVLRLNDAEKKEREKAREADRQARFTAAMGLRLVFKALGAAGKPVVVHNGMYDLMFMMDAFQGPLPETLVEFKALLTECFPSGIIYDTKYISTREDLLELSLGDTGVEGLYNTLVKDMPDAAPAIVLAEGYQKYAGEEGGGEGSVGFAHEAGYDSYLTGAIFARMKAILEKKEDYLPTVAMRIYNYRSLFETYLGGEDRMNYDKAGQHVFYLGLEKEAKGVKTDDLMNVFGKYSTHTSVLWIDDTGAFAVVTADDLKEEDVLAAVATMPKGVRLLTFKRWFQQKSGGGGRRRMTLRVHWLGS